MCVCNVECHADFKYGTFAVCLPPVQLVGEVKLDKPVQALDTTFGGRMVALGGVGAQLIMAKMS